MLIFGRVYKKCMQRQLDLQPSQLGQANFIVHRKNKHDYSSGGNCASLKSNDQHVTSGRRY